MDIFWALLLIVILYWIHKTYDKKLVSDDQLKYVYTAEYTPCKYESGFSVISVHTTMDAAIEAIKEHEEHMKETEGEWFSPSMVEWRTMSYELRP